MQQMPDEPYRELRALFNHLVETVQAARQRFGPRDGRFQALDDVVRQAHAYQHTTCDRCGTPFRREVLHPESYTVAGYVLVCPRCNRELGVRRSSQETTMNPLPEALHAHIVEAVTAWAAPRYGARMTAGPPPTVTITQASSASAADYLVTLAILDGPTALRVKVTVAPDGRLEVHD